MTNREFSYYTYDVGKEGYKPITNKLVWNVISTYNNEIIPINLFEYNWIFLKELLYAKKHYSKDYEKFCDHVRGWLQHEYWSRCEYEVIVINWTGRECEYLLDIYTQVMLNWDRFIDYVWNNKHLITKKKLGLE